MILAIDTATEFAGLALLSAEKLLAAEIWHAGRNHTVEFAPRLHTLLTRAAITPADLTGIAVCVGPGSYTGVRIGVALAKGLALPNQLPAVGVSSLEITAHPHRNQPLPVQAIVRAGRKRIITAQFNRVDGVWVETEAARITTVAELAASLTEPVLVAGEFSAAEAEILRAESGGRARVVGAGERTRHPGVLAALGAEKLAAGASGVLAELQPLYMKNPGE